MMIEEGVCVEGRDKFLSTVSKRPRVPRLVTGQVTGG